MNHAGQTISLLLLLTPLVHAIETRSVSGSIRVRYDHPFKSFVAECRSFSGVLSADDSEFTRNAKLKLDAPMSCFRTGVHVADHWLETNTEIVSFESSSMQRLPTGAVRFLGNLSNGRRRTDIELPWRCTEKDRDIECDFAGRVHLEELGLRRPELIGVPGFGSVIALGAVRFKRTEERDED